MSVTLLSRVTRIFSMVDVKSVTVERAWSIRFFISDFLLSWQQIHKHHTFITENKLREYCEQNIFSLINRSTLTNLTYYLFPTFAIFIEVKYVKKIYSVLISDFSLVTICIFHKDHGKRTIKTSRS
jgi:hypothetical protein